MCTEKVNSLYHNIGSPTSFILVLGLVKTVPVEGLNILARVFFLVIRERPIFFRPHSKAILSRAIHNDTEFLAQQMVMDYSLLVGIDEARSELVIGIIGECALY